MSTYKYQLKGLDCAHCASKIEVKLNDLKEVEHAHINFIQTQLNVNTTQENNQQFVNELQTLVDSIEDGIQVIPENEVITSIEEKKYDFDLIRIIITTFGFALGFFIELTQWQALIYYGIFYFIIAQDVLGTTFRQISKGNWFDENFLMTIATLGAFGIGEYAEAIAVMLFYQVGEWFQGRAVDHSRKSISDLMDIRPDFAWIKSANNWTQVDPNQVAVDEIILVKPGEKVPLDGIVTSGNSTLDTSALTGESLPQSISVDGTINSGVINLTSPIEVQVTKPFAQSTVNQIIELVENASAKKAKTEKFITKFARYYTPIVVFLAIGLAIVPPLIIGSGWENWLYRALQFLVISCPCALVISVPLSFYGGIGGAAKHGILVKGGNYLEELAKVQTMVLDKTGTITKGNFAVDHVETNGIDEAELIEKLAHLEGHSSHPIALSIREYYGKDVEIERVSELEDIAGRGLKGKVDGQLFYAGNRQLMQDINVEVPATTSVATLVYVSDGNELLGVVQILDQIKEDSKQAIHALKSIGVDQVVLLSGDRQETVDEIAETVGVDVALGHLLPQDKVTEFEKLLDQSHNQNGNIAFVGDGINDAPVLARADVGIAMGGLGSDAAIESADIVLMDDALTKLPTAIEISRKTLKIAKQNIYLAIGIKVFFLILATFGISTMWEAIFADVGVTIIAVFNALRTLK
ncbi:cadmium-translocating P-type ATPase [Aerococcaceae bacterium DSM 111176]|nr:cadmium-translocating P-type ATPase [Aerococcaceae bacterium DSM 111176]